MKRVLVTPLNTKLDQQLVENLLSDRYIVRIISQGIDAGNPLLKLPVEIFPGNPANADTITKAARSCDYLIDTQRAFGNRTAIEPCYHPQSIIEAAEKAGVNTVILIASQGTSETEHPAVSLNGNRVSRFTATLQQPTSLVEDLIARSAGSGINLIFIRIGSLNAAASQDENTNPVNPTRDIIGILKNGLHGEHYLLQSTPQSDLNIRRKAAAPQPLHNLKHTQEIFSKLVIRILASWTKLFGITALIKK